MLRKLASLFTLLAAVGISAQAQLNFTALAPLSQASNVWYVAAGDLNGDNRVDLVIPVSQATGNTIFVQFGNGNGTFTSPAVGYSNGQRPRSVALGDIDNDGDLDIVVSNVTTREVGALRNNGSGAFTVQPTYPAGTTPQEIALADVNGDNRLDIISVDSAALQGAFFGGVSVFLGNGNGTFQDRTTFQTGSNPFSVTVADFNSDGKQDIVTSNINASANNIAFLKGNGNGTFAAPIPYPAGGQPYSVKSGDMDGDGNRDVVVCNAGSTDNTVSILRGNGDGTFQPKVDYATGTRPRSVALVDMNADGKLDVVTADNAANTVSVLLNVGNGTLNPPLAFPAGTGPQCVIAANLNGDTLPDLIVAENTGNAARVLLNRTTFGRLSGLVALNGLANTAGLPLRIRLQSSTLSFAYEVPLDARGGYDLTNTLPATYDITTRLPYSLIQRENGVVVAGSPVTQDFSLINGDANEDNAVDIADLLALIGAYNQAAPAAGYLEAADFNRDDVNDIDDLLILIANFNALGDAP